MILEISDQSHVAAARRNAAVLSEEAGFDADTRGRVALVVTELATNLLKHAKRGQMVLERRDHASGPGIEVISLDKGPGIQDFGVARVDGYSTAGTVGGGLGIIDRQSDVFETYSRPDSGTIVVARIFSQAPSANVQGLALGSVVAPFPGEIVCGDAWAVAETSSGPTMIVVDGSGHGTFAQKAAAAAIEVFLANTTESCETIMDFIHRGLLSTRGAAVALARIDKAAGMVRFVGVGNIAGMVMSGSDIKRMVSHNGTAGHLAPRIREFTYPFAQGASVLLHSDGISNKWDLSTYPGLSAAHPSVIAGVIFRDFRRERDDASVVCMRLPRT